MIASPIVHANQSTLDKLRDLLFAELTPLLSGKSVIFIDYPIYWNVGDYLITQGAEYLFEKVGARVNDRISGRNKQRLFRKKLDSQTVLVLNGGGNFGDIYPHHQELRKEVVSAFPNNKVIILPQSIHYNNAIALKEDIEVFKSHPDLHLYVRDQHSFEEMKQSIPDGRLKKLPDMAFTMSQRWNKTLPDKHKPLRMRRRDCETQSIEDQPVEAFDWEDLCTTRHQFGYDFARRLARAENKLNCPLGLSWFWKKYSDHVVNIAVERFQSANVVDTDRLHGLILALLLGRDVVMRDNSYGKLSRFSREWLGLESLEEYQRAVNQ
ncbi:polysaccharide pyruvyl transferase family protein [Vibrio maritimus]|uniref:polysaccharide pyruvyl transferase family protein n=1 Tax=Vibrio maritimus TaxID=990268 RepID=UPI0040690DED